MKIFLSIFCTLLFSGLAFAQKITFTPQWTPQAQFAGYYVALEKGFYAEEGLDVSIEHPTASYSSINMLKDGSSDIISCELIQAMVATDKGDKLVNILQTTQHSTLVLLSRIEGVSSMADLAGRRVGTWKIGFSEIPHMIDEEQNLGIEWIKFINPINLYISGAIDATLVKSYNEQILFSMSGITPVSILRFSELGYDYPEDGVYVSEKFFEKYPNQCRKFAEASRRGWEWARDNRKETLDIVMKYVKAERVPTNIYNQKWMLDTILEAQVDVKGGTPSYSLNPGAFNHLNTTLLKYGYISKPIEYQSFTR